MLAILTSVNPKILSSHQLLLGRLTKAIYLIDRKASDIRDHPDLSAIHQEICERWTYSLPN